MSILRNKEIKGFMLLLGIISTILLLIGFTINILTGVLIGITVILLCSCFLIYTSKRYQRIERLSKYLRRISIGDYTLDIRDNTEGELSILKSEIYKVTLMLSEYNDQLKQEKIHLANQMADISHQLKTPLTSMMVMTDLIRDEDLPTEKRKEFTHQIHSQLERIEWLVTSLLKLSKLDAGVVIMKQEPISGRELVLNALEPLLISLELKEISYCLEVDENLTIHCDSKWTTEAILNILKNCMEHTPKGGNIKVQGIDNPLFSEIRIQDSGVGIEKGDLPHIFTRFYRGKNASPDSVGIGLAMSQSIINSQQGNILVSSEIGKGSTFSIRFYKSVI